MIVGRLRQAKLREDAVDVLFDGAFGYPKALGDAGVRSPFGHEREDLALAGGQHLEGIPGTLCGHEFLHKCRIDD
jgi:hypothetical protein